MGDAQVNREQAEARAERAWKVAIVAAIVTVVPVLGWTLLLVVAMPALIYAWFAASRLKKAGLPGGRATQGMKLIGAACGVGFAGTVLVGVLTEGREAGAPVRAVAEPSTQHEAASEEAPAASDAPSPSGRADESAQLAEAGNSVVPAGLPAVPKWEWEPAWTDERVLRERQRLGEERTAANETHRLVVKAMADGFLKSALKEDADAYMRAKDVHEWVTHGRVKAENIEGYLGLFQRVATQESFKAVLKQMREGERIDAEYGRKDPGHIVETRWIEMVEVANGLLDAVTSPGIEGKPEVLDRHSLSARLQWAQEHEEAYRERLAVLRDRIELMAGEFDRLTEWAVGVRPDYGAKAAATLRRKVERLDTLLENSQPGLFEHHEELVATLPEKLSDIAGASKLGRLVKPDRLGHPEMWEHPLAVAAYADWQARLAERELAEFRSHVNRGPRAAIDSARWGQAIDVLTVLGVRPDRWFSDYYGFCDAAAAEFEAPPGVIQPVRPNRVFNQVSLTPPERLYHARWLAAYPSGIDYDAMLKAFGQVKDAMSAFPEEWDEGSAVIVEAHAKVQADFVQEYLSKRFEPLVPKRVVALLDASVDPAPDLLAEWRGRVEAENAEREFVASIGDPVEGALDPADPITFVDALELTGTRRVHHAKLVERLARHTKLAEVLKVREAVEADAAEHPNMWSDEIKAAYTQLQALQWRAYWMSNGKDRVREILNKHQAMMQTGKATSYVERFETAAKSLTREEAEVSFRLISEGLLDEEVFGKWVGPSTFGRYGPDPSNPELWKAVWRVVSQQPVEAAQN